MILVISSSLNAQSRSLLLAENVLSQLQSLDVDCEMVDLAKENLPRCNAGSCYGEPAVVEIAEKIKAASGVVLATPVYNYSICSEAKNLVELTGQAWKATVAGFLCAAGGQGSYMAIMNLANSLMLDFRTFVLPRFVYATGNSFAGNEITDNDLLDRLGQFAEEMNRVSKALIESRFN